MRREEEEKEKIRCKAGRQRCGSEADEVNEAERHQASITTSNPITPNTQ